MSETNIFFSSSVCLCDPVDFPNPFSLDIFAGADVSRQRGYFLFIKVYMGTKKSLKAIYNL